MVSDDVVIVDDTQDQEPVELSEDWVNTEIQQSNEMQLADEFDDWDDAKTLGDSKSDIEEWRAIRLEQDQAYQQSLEVDRFKVKSFPPFRLITLFLCLGQSCCAGSGKRRGNEKYNFNSFLFMSFLYCLHR